MNGSGTNGTAEPKRLREERVEELSTPGLWQGGLSQANSLVTRPFGLTLVGVKGAWAVARLVSQQADQPAFETPVAARGVSNRVVLTFPL